MACVPDTWKPVPLESSFSITFDARQHRAVRRAELYFMVLLASEIEASIAKLLFRGCIAFEIDEFITGYEVHR